MVLIISIGNLCAAVTLLNVLVTCQQADQQVNISTMKTKGLENKTYKLANEILEAVYMERHKELFARIQALMMMKIEEGILSNLDRNLKSPTNLTDEGNILFEKEKISTLDPIELKTKLIEKVKASRTESDAIGVHLSENNKYLVIAGNIKTTQIEDLHDLQMWGKILSEDAPTKLFKYGEYGFQSRDAFVIEAILKDNEYLPWNSESGFEVVIIIPNQDPVKLAEVEHLVELIKKIKIEETLEELDQLIENAESLLAKNGLNERISQNKSQLNIEYQSAFNRLQFVQNSLYDSQPPPEIQILKHRDTFPGFDGTDAIITTTSRQSFQKYTDTLKKPISVDFSKSFKTHGRDILSEDKSQKAKDFQISYRFLSDWIERIQKQSKSVSKDSGPSYYVFTTLDTEKESTNAMNPDGNGNIDSIRSKEFLDEYRKADNSHRREMTDFAASNTKKLVGNPNDVANVKRVIEYENMQQHNSKTKIALNTLKTDIRTGYPQVEVLGRSTRLSPTRITKQTRTEFFTTKNAVKVTNIVGNYLLAKSIVSGVNNEDTTGLAIMGGRIGGEFGIELVGKLGSKMSKTASKISKSFKFLGEAAGPLGGAVDIGLSAWGVAKAAARLVNPSATKYEQNEAIANIVQNCIDIAITATVTTVLTIVAAPLAPVIGFIVNSFVSHVITLYKAVNHVNSLDSKVKLLDSEKREERERYVDGKQTSGYIQDLIRATHANNIIVNATLQLLDDNPDIIGRVIPSRTFKFQGACHLDKAHCKHGLFSKCIIWEKTVTLAKNCFEQDGECDDYYDICKSGNYPVPDSATGFDWFQCSCDGKEKVQLGHEQNNSKVDFRQESFIYLDRSVPDPPSNKKYKMLCAPSSKTDMGYKISQRNSKYGYLCENAMGIKRSSGAGKFMLYELGIGKDEIYLDSNDATNSNFIVGDGIKNFHGNKGEDTFLITGPCVQLHGTLDGHSEGSMNSVIFNETCASGGKISINLQNPKKTLFGNNLGLTLQNIQNIFGRSGESENITIDCSTKFVSGGGGMSASALDIIRISLTKCRLDLKIQAAKYTNVEISNFQLGQLVVAVPPRAPGISISFDSGNPLSYSSRIFLSFSSNIIGEINQENGINSLSLYLPSTKSDLRNLGSNIIADVDLNSGQLNINSGSNNSEVKLPKFQQYFGMPRKTDKIKCACDSRFIAGNDGSSRSQPDLINVPKNDKCNMTLNILASGFTTIASQASVGVQNIHVQDGSNHELGFTASIVVSNSLSSNIILRFPAQHILSYTSKILNTNHIPLYSIEMKLTEDRNVDFNFLLEMENNQTSSASYLSQPEIIFTTNADFEPEGRLLIQQSGSGLVVHFLEDNGAGVAYREGIESRTRSGAQGISNLFYLLGRNWDAQGGQLDDIFILKSDSFTGTISGNRGTNTLILDSGLNSSAIYVDLPKCKIQGVSENENASIPLIKIQVVQGRKLKQDTILCDCDTSYVNLEGGLDSIELGNDYILINSSLNCSNNMNLTIVVPQNTVVNNSASTGNFVYLIEHEQNFRINSQSGNNRFNFSEFYQFQFGFSKIKFAEFNSGTEQLFFNLNSDTEEVSKLEYKMANFNNATCEYLQPTFQFLESDRNMNQIKADVRVLASNGEIHTSISIENEFEEVIIGISGTINDIVVNIKNNLVSLGRIIGSDDSDDNFWIMSVNSIDEINGRSSGSAGNSLTFASNLHAERNLTIDLRQQGSIRFSDSNSILVRSLANIQIFRGRKISKDHETVLVACDTSFVSNAYEILVTETNCTNYKISLIIDNKIQRVTFDKRNEEASEDNMVFQGGSFFYRFETLRSFDLDFDFWTTIRKTKQIFYLKFEIADLESISYSNFEISYVISNQIYRHSLDPFLLFDQQFFDQPKFMSEDEFQIQASRHGDIYMTHYGKKMSLQHIRNTFVSLHSTIANRLGVTFIISTESDFIYIGNNQTTLNTEENKNINSVPNILSNSDLRSHLVGSGGPNTMYTILDLKSDVYIYTGLEFALKEVHTIDLTDVIWKIRNITQTKYVPTIKQIDGINANDFNLDLEIVMSEFEETFPGKIIIVNGVDLVTRIQILLNAAVMEFQTVKPTMNTIHLEKRSIQTTFDWVLKPKPIIVTPGSLFILAPEDLEIGQEIMSDEVRHSNPASEFNEPGKFELVKNGSELLLTNLASTANVDNVLTFALLDFYDAKRSDFGLDSLQNVTIKFGNLAFALDFREINELSGIRDWEDILEESEEFHLKYLPDIRRQFGISIWERLWKSYTYLIYLVIGGCALISVSLIFGFALKDFFCWKYNFKLEVS